MATQTTNIGLTKPDGTDNVSRQVINDNYDIIDTEIGKRMVLKYEDFTVWVTMPNYSGMEIGEEITKTQIDIRAEAASKGITVNQIIGITNVEWPSTIRDLCYPAGPIQYSPYPGNVDYIEFRIIKTKSGYEPVSTARLDFRLIYI